VVVHEKGRLRAVVWDTVKSNLSLGSRWGGPPRVGALSQRCVMLHVNEEALVKLSSQTRGWGRVCNSQFMFVCVVAGLRLQHELGRSNKPRVQSVTCTS
jgi:hypothetical protein